MSDEMNAPRKIDFKTLLRTVRQLKREMDEAQKVQAPSEATQDKQDCAAVDDRVIQTVMRQCGDGQQPTDSATEFAYASQQMK